MVKERVKQKREQKIKQQQQQAVRRKRNLLITIGSAVAAVVIIAVLAVVLRPKASFSYQDHPMLGSANAKVKIVEFGDFKCSACKYFEKNIYPSLKKDYIDTGKVQLYFYNFPFIDADSSMDALAAESVYHQNPQAFWTYYNALYKTKGMEKVATETPAKLVQLAKDTGIQLDMNTLKQDIVSKKYQSEVQADIKKGNNLNVNSTPSIFIDGVNMGNNGINYAAIKAKIDSELKKGQF